MTATGGTQRPGREPGRSPSTDPEFENVKERLRATMTGAEGIDLDAHAARIAAVVVRAARNQARQAMRGTGIRSW